MLCRRACAAISASVTTLLLLAGAVPALAQWTVTHLHPSSAVRSSYATAGDGPQVVGEVTERAAIWSGLDPSSFSDLHPLSPSEWLLSSVSDSTGGEQVGVIARFLVPGGTGGVRIRVTRAALWRGTASSYVSLHPDGASYSYVGATSGTHQVGWVVGAMGRRASLWNGSANSWVDLTPAGAETAAAEDVFGTQQVGGVSFSADGDDHAALWSGSPESWVDLHPAGHFRSYALAVHQDRQVGFVVGADRARTRAALWNGSAASWVDLHPSNSLGDSRANDILGDFQVGSVEVLGGSIDSTASLWTGSSASWVDLGSFLPAGYIRSSASSIWMHDGSYFIAGSAYNAQLLRYEAVVWSRPVPEPTGTAASLFAALWAARRCRRSSKHAELRNDSDLH